MDDLTQKTNEELFALYKKERNPEIRRELTMRYLYIATSVARQMYDIYSSAMQMEDAVNEGVLAIMRGIDSYDPDKNVKFSTYISPRIRGVMLDYMRKQEWMPRGYRKQLSLIEDAMQTLETDLGRPPTKEEVAEHVGLSVKRCQRILSLRPMSLVQSLDVMMQDKKPHREARYQATKWISSQRRHLCGKSSSGCSAKPSVPWIRKKEPFLLFTM